MDRAGCGVVDRGGGGEARFARAAAAAIVMTTNNRFARASLPRSFDSFRQPNFVLVADILFFLVQRYDPSLRLSQDIETEQERVTFLKSIAEVMATKMRIKLNTKKLYGADGYAVKEMLKIASMLDQSIREAKKEDEMVDGVPPLSTKVGDIRRCRQLATEITQQGAKLFDMLKKEEMNRDERQRVVGSDLELELVASEMRTQIATVTESVHTVERQIADIASDESNLEAKIEKKRADLERNQQRLKSLTTVRPAFMDEYEQIEGDLRGHYGEYLEKYRNMVYLEHLLDKHMATEQQEVEEATRNLRRMQERLRQEEAAMMRNGRGGFGPGGGMGNFGGGPGGGKFGPPGHEDPEDEDSSDDDSSDEGEVEMGPGGRGGGGGGLDSEDESLLSSDDDDDVRNGEYYPSPLTVPWSFPPIERPR
jgi:clusterin-associated protein 1